MISIECFKGLPIEYESFLIEKYDSFITTCRYIEVYYPTYDINYMLVYENSNLSELLIFGNRGNKATCFNSLVSIDQNIVTEFQKNIFEKYPFIKKIEIVASYKNYFLNKSFLINKNDDQILNLPSTIDDFYLKLGYHTRKNIKNRRVKLLIDYPKVKFITKFGVDIEESIVDKIIQLNCDIMKQKGIIPGIDNTYKNNIYKYSQHYGCVTYIEIDGVIVAGCISTVLNKGVFAHVLAHDNNFSKYHVGEACMFYLIQTSIEKGLSTFHFLWGENELKKRFMAKPNILYSYYIYKSNSFDYFYNRLKISYQNILANFKNSKFTKPIKKAIKYYRKKKMGIVTVSIYIIYFLFH